MWYLIWMVVLTAALLFSDPGPVVEVVLLLGLAFVGSIVLTALVSYTLDGVAVRVLRKYDVKVRVVKGGLAVAHTGSAQARGLITWALKRISGVLEELVRESIEGGGYYGNKTRQPDNTED